MLIALTVLGFLFGVLGILSPWLYDMRDRFKFHRQKGPRIAGDYLSVFSNPAAKSKSPPVTWEKGLITQKGARVHYRCRENDLSFNYEMVGTIYQDIVVGYWYSRLPGEHVHGCAYLYITPRGDLVGIWVGDAIPHQKTFGYWALSRRKEFLESFVTNMHTKGKFKMIDLLHSLE